MDVPTAVTSSLTPESPARARSETSLRRRVSQGFVVAVILLLAGAALASLGLVTAAHDRTRLLAELDPAIEHADTYETELVDQSADARLHAELGTGEPLTGYRQGVAAAVEARSQLRLDLRTLPALALQLDRLDATIRSWQDTFVTPEVARPGPDPALTTRARITASSLAFVGIRQSFASLQAGLLHVRTGSVRGFNDALDLLVALIIAVFVGVAGLLLAVLIGLRRLVLAPLSVLGADSRLVTAGDFEHEVTAAGPIEIAGLARDIDAMRSRVVEDLRDLEAAHRTLAAQRLELEERSLELVRSNRDLEQFAYVASHDLQEPLRKVASFCGLLAERYEGQLDEKAQLYIGFAVDGAKRMQSLVNDLLSFSRVGRFTDRWSEVALGDAADTAISNLEGRITRSDATVTVHGTLPTVRGDASLLASLFQNLIGNAIKFRADDPPVIDVSSRRGERWEIRVADNGIGIEPQFAERVFVIFQRLHSRDRYEGTGIGLALCRRIVEFHGGEIALEAGPSPGATILFTLPIEPIDSLLTDEEASEEPHDRP